MIQSVGVAAVALALGAVVLITAGVKFTKIVDELADRTRLGEALAGAVLLGAATSLPGLITTVVGASDGEAGFAVSNAVGGIAAQTTFLVFADMAYRRVNLEHAAASLPNVVQTMVLMALIGIVLSAAAGPEVRIGWIHPATLVLPVVYGYGLVLARRARTSPMWEPQETAETVVDDPDLPGESTSLQSLWTWFAGLALIVAITGFVVGEAGIALARETPLSGSVVAALFTSVVTSLPELVTVLTAVRIGALTLAVSNIVGGNSFDVLFVFAADLAFTSGSVYNAVDGAALFLLSLTVLLTALLATGMLTRERRHIGFEGLAILGCYFAGIAALVSM